MRRMATMTNRLALLGNPLIESIGDPRPFIRVRGTDYVCIHPSEGTAHNKRDMLALSSRWTGRTGIPHGADLDRMVEDSARVMAAIFPEMPDYVIRGIALVDRIVIANAWGAFYAPTVELDALPDIPGEEDKSPVPPQTVPE
jgi:hypothetical protein